MRSFPALLVAKRILLIDNEPKWLCLKLELLNPY
jgi:hypothetical protein